ncbi:hypothetical protein AAFF_G00078280 [Aldrovandia affinis]|uniref:Uncharacterized protein n=1 Tax=Aldrovandia affinis TaxID=143900 RepID=A0AAD7RXT8_9TELE|nr:hypothetical protein AAFF_G00078280 [Aldrovandia affinis]
MISGRLWSNPGRVNLRPRRVCPCRADDSRLILKVLPIPDCRVVGIPLPDMKGLSQLFRREIDPRWWASSMKSSEALYSSTCKERRHGGHDDCGPILTVKVLHY